LDDYYLEHTNNEVLIMSIFKRLSATLVSRIDHVVGEIENHEAVIQASINEMSKKVAQAKVRLKQVHREADKLKQQMQSQQDNVKRWQQRAIHSAKTDEATALDCMQRAQTCKSQASKHEQALNHYVQTSETLAANIQTSEQRLQEMKQKLTLMRARESSNSALTATHNYDGEVIQFVEDSFDRWEVNISKDEILLDNVDNTDAIEHSFITQEQQNALRDELTKLLEGDEQS
jgi:phage shock protein A